MEPIAVTKPYKVNDRRGQSRSAAAARVSAVPNYSRSWGSSDDLFKAARQTDQRKFIYDLNADIHRNLSPYGRRTLVTLGKWLYANSPVIRGAINDMAFYPIESWTPKYYGRPAEGKGSTGGNGESRGMSWGSEAEAWLFEHDKVCDVAGGELGDYLENIIRAILVEGDIATVYTERAGYPLLQVIPGHRIGSDDGADLVEGGEFDGAAIIDGVILDDYGAAIGYRVLTADGYNDFSANDVNLHFIREYPNQVRGISQLASILFDCQDIRETKDLELAFQKLAASTGLIIENEAGEADATKSLIQTPETPFTSTGAKNADYGEIIGTDGVKNRFFKAGLNCKVSEMKTDRPSANAQEYKYQTYREIFAALGWPIDFALDPTKIGGAPARMMMQKVNKTICRIQKKIVRPAYRRFNGYRLRKAISRGDLAENVDWYKIDAIGPAKLTADEKYSSSVAIEQMHSGVRSRSSVAAELGQEDIDDVIDNNIAFEKRLQEKAKAAGVDPNRIVLLTPNGNSAVAPPAQQEGTEEGQAEA